MPTPAAPPDPEQQRIAQEREAARTSHLFATTNTRQIATAAVPGAPLVFDGTVAPVVAASNDLTAQDHKLAFLNGTVGGGALLQREAALVQEVDVKHQAVRARNPRPSQEFRRRRGGLGLPARVTDQRFAHRPSSSTMNTIGLGCSIADGFVPRSGECGCSLMSIS
jgi:hypothetical protein